VPHLQHKSQNLYLAGPIIEIIVLPPKPIIEALKSKGEKVPAAKAIGLIDTGATCTCIDKSIAQLLKLISHDIKFLSIRIVKIRITPTFSN